MFTILLILTWGLKKKGQQNKGWFEFEVGVEACIGGLCLFGDKKIHLLKALLTCSFITLLLNSFDLLRYGSKSRKRYTPRRCSCVLRGGEGFGNCSTWRGANDLPGGSWVRGNYGTGVN